MVKQQMFEWNDQFITVASLSLSLSHSLIYMHTLASNYHHTHTHSKWWERCRAFILFHLERLFIWSQPKIALWRRPFIINTELPPLLLCPPLPPHCMLLSLWASLTRSLNFLVVSTGEALTLTHICTLQANQANECPISACEAKKKTNLRAAPHKMVHTCTSYMGAAAYLL